MRPIPDGYQTTFETVVTPEMTVAFEELGKVHPIYATYWLVRHLELTGRKIVLPFLEADEDALGYEVRVRHLDPALPGMRVRIVGEHYRTEQNRVYVHCRAYNELADLIGAGETTQVVLPRRKIEAIFAELTERWAAHREPGHQGS